VTTSAGPFDVVAVETNWILDVTLHQDNDSEELLLQAQHGVVQILLPSICIAESVTAFAVLATILTASRANRCRKFVSHDADFQADGVLTYMRTEGLEYFPSAYPIVGPLRGHMPAR